MRAGFLTFMFPKIIDWGRTWFIKASHTQPSEVETPPLEMPTDPRLFNAPTGVQGEDQPLEPMAPAPVEETAGRGFDLYFLRSSLLVDAAVTSVAAYATEGWHMYIGKRIEYIILQVFLLTVNYWANSGFSPTICVRDGARCQRCHHGNVPAFST